MCDGPKLGEESEPEISTMEIELSPRTVSTPIQISMNETFCSI